MNPIDEAEHIRVLLREGSMMTHEEKMVLIARIRYDAIIRIVKIRPETLTEGHDLTLPYQGYHFIGELRKEIIPPELAAYVDLLEACTRSMDNKQIFVDAICYAYAKTDGGLITGHKHKKSQREKAKQPRGIIREIKEKLVKQYPDYPPEDLWSHLFAELEGMGFDPEEMKLYPKEKSAKTSNKLYKYYRNDKSKTIKFETFRGIKIDK